MLALKVSQHYTPTYIQLAINRGFRLSLNVTHLGISLMCRGKTLQTDVFSWVSDTQALMCRCKTLQTAVFSWFSDTQALMCLHLSLGKVYQFPYKTYRYFEMEMKQVPYHYVSISICLDPSTDGTASLYIGNWHCLIVIICSFLDDN